MNDDPERSMSIAEAAVFLGVGKRSLYRWRDEGILPSYKIGGRLLFRRADLIEFREQFRERRAA